MFQINSINIGKLSNLKVANFLCLHKQVNIKNLIEHTEKLTELLQINQYTILFKFA